MAEPTVAITGIGAVLPCGLGLDAAWDHWREGTSAIGAFAHPLLHTQRITHFGAIPADVRAKARESTAFKLRRYGTEPSLWAVNAAEQAIADSAVDWDAIDETRRGAFSGQGDYSFPDFGAIKSSLAVGRNDRGEIDSKALARHAMYRRGADPFISIKSLANNALALTSLKFRCRGIGCAYVQNEAAAISALNRAIVELRDRRCDVALVIACGSYAEPFTLAQMWSRGLLGAKEAPPDGVMSFDDRARGTVLGEGAVVLVLERRKDAEKRSANIRGLIDVARGYAAPAHRTESLSKPAYRHIVPVASEKDTWAVLADGRGHPDLDRIEARALVDALPEGTPVSSTRAVTGVVPAAGVLLDIALATRVIASGALPPIAGLVDAIDDGPAWVRAAPVERTFDRALCLQQSFSGYYSAAAVHRVA